jgi:hypothetical protein
LTWKLQKDIVETGTSITPAKHRDTAGEITTLEKDCQEKESFEIKKEVLGNHSLAIRTVDNGTLCQIENQAGGAQSIENDFKEVIETVNKAVKLLKKDYSLRKKSLETAKQTQVDIRLLLERCQHESENEDVKPRKRSLKTDFKVAMVANIVTIICCCMVVGAYKLFMDRLFEATCEITNLILEDFWDTVESWDILRGFAE